MLIDGDDGGQSPALIRAAVVENHCAATCGLRVGRGRLIANGRSRGNAPCVQEAGCQGLDQRTCSPIGHPTRGTWGRRSALILLWALLL